MSACEICGTVHAAHQAHVFRPTTPLRNQTVTSKGVICNHCVTKDAEIARLRNQLEKLAEVKPKAKRDRAEYMRGYRAEKRA